MNTRRTSLTFTLLFSIMHTALGAAENISPAAAVVPVVSAGQPAGAVTEAPKPKFQDKSEGIEMPAATVDEPKVKAFGRETTGDTP